jgi:hypothetical protein
MREEGVLFQTMAGEAAAPCSEAGATVSDAGATVEERRVSAALECPYME